MSAAHKAQADATAAHSEELAKLDQRRATTESEANQLHAQNASLLQEIEALTARAVAGPGGEASSSAAAQILPTGTLGCWQHA